MARNCVADMKGEVRYLGKGHAGSVDTSPLMYNRIVVAKLKIYSFEETIVLQ